MGDGLDRRDVLFHFFGEVAAEQVDAADCLEFGRGGPEDLVFWDWSICQGGDLGEGGGRWVVIEELVDDCPSLDSGCTEDEGVV